MKEVEININRYAQNKLTDSEMLNWFDRFDLSMQKEIRNKLIMCMEQAHPTDEMIAHSIKLAPIKETMTPVVIFNTKPFKIAVNKIKNLPDSEIRKPLLSCYVYSEQPIHIGEKHFVKMVVLTFGTTLISMNYIDFGLIRAMLNKGKTIEQLLGYSKNENYSTVEWISIYLDKGEFCIDYHHVFDEREKGVENIYDFSYVEPDDMYGKRMHQTKDFESLMAWTFKNFKILSERFLPFDYLNDELEQQK
ncbi:hypothetical protein E9993_06535 [Labilibacter sediminis]|nr:hypothetical protein E9993_06535 [Labilibacter sediminis]